jgi:uncharacterized protein (TIGR03435 family)
VTVDFRPWRLGRIVISEQLLALKRRLIHILTQRSQNKLGSYRKMLLAAVSAAAIAGPILCGVVFPQNCAPSMQTATEPLPSFEVASIKPSRPGEIESSGIDADGRFARTDVTPRWLMEYAYYNVETAVAFQVLGGPRWMYTERYDVDAKVEDSVAEQFHKLPWAKYREQYGLMVQSLLADRFKLKIHQETRMRRAYALVVAKGGPKFLQTEYAVPAPGRSLTSSGGRPLPSLPPGMKRIAVHANIGLLALGLSRQPEIGRRVMDDTGLERQYDLILQWWPDQSFAEMPSRGISPGNEAASPANVSGPSIFTALQQQLGLKLKPTIGPVDVIVIDHIERPSEN